jgi:diaminopimelate epimerase
MQNLVQNQVRSTGLSGVSSFSRSFRGVTRSARSFARMNVSMNRTCGWREGKGLHSKTLRSRTCLFAKEDELVDVTTAEGYPDPRGSSQVYFYKYQGLGNDFIMVDNRHADAPIFSSEEALALCDRRFGIGGDGIIFLMSPPKQTSQEEGGQEESDVVEYDYAMRMYNSDGTEPEMCGNGIRCLARFVAEVEDHSVPRSYKFHTLAGLIVPEVNPNGLVSVDMGEPRLETQQIPTTLEPTGENKEYANAVVLRELEVGGEMESVPDPEELFAPYEERMEKVIKRKTQGELKERWLVTCVSMGNPHAVTFGRPGRETLGGVLDVDNLDVDYYGPMFETHAAFPEKINTHFCQAIYENPDSLEDLTDAVRVLHWERGAGKTLACGTGACSVVVAGVLEGRLKEKCNVYVPGGPLQIEWRRKKDNHVIMTGPAQLVYKGLIPV